MKINGGVVFMKISMLAQASAFVLCGLASGAQAAIVEFIHEGHPVSLGGVLDTAEDPLAQGAQPGMSGIVTIDTEAYGDGFVAGTILEIISSRENYGTDSPAMFSYSITGGGGVIKEGDDYPMLTDIPFLEGVTGFISQFFSPGSVADNYVRLDFDEAGNVAYWFGQDYDGGIDWIWNTQGASFGGIFGCVPGGDEWCTHEPGTWSINVVEGEYAPSPVPLPLSAALLVSAVAFLPVARQLKPLPA